MNIYAMEVGDDAVWVRNADHEVWDKATIHGLRKAPDDFASLSAVEKLRAVTKAARGIILTQGPIGDPERIRMAVAEGLFPLRPIYSVCLVELDVDATA